MDQQHSITKRLLNMSTTFAVVIILIAGAAMFLFFYSMFRTHNLNDLARHVNDRAQVYQQLFDQVRSVQSMARKSFGELQGSFDEADIAAQFDEYFPLQEDGTRRSADNLFEGRTILTEGRTYGVGAFMADGAEMSPKQKETLLTAYHLVRQFGPVLGPNIDNFWFFTPEDRLVIFAPNRDDNLEFYRKNAPGDFGFQDEEFAINARPENNPARIMTCTSLVSIMYDDTGRILTSGCQTPVDQGSEYVGAFGVSLLLDGWLQRAIEPTIDGVTTMMSTNDGDLIAHPTLLREVDINSSEAQRISGTLGLAEFIGSTEGEFGIGVSACKGFFLVQSTIAGPDWRLIMAVPKSKIMLEAFKSAALSAFAAMMAVLVIALIMRALLSRLIAVPLAELAAEAVEIASEDGNSIARFTPRKDEIGRLASALSLRDRQLRDLLEGLEEQINERTEKLTKSQDRLEQLNSSLRHFAFIAAHDLQTPLRQVETCAEIIHDDIRQAEIKLSDDGTTALGHIRVSMKHMRQMVRSLYLLCSLESREIEQANVSLEDIVDVALMQLRSVIEQYEAKVDCAKLPVILGAEELLVQLFQNLIVNACKYHNGPRAEIRIDSDLDTEEGRQLIIVEDNGPGIPAELHESIFDPFRRGANHGTTEGAGIGLTLCRKIVQLHGGKIYVDPVFENGTRIVIDLPITR